MQPVILDQVSMMQHHSRHRINVCYVLNVLSTLIYMGLYWKKHTGDSEPSGAVVFITDRTNYVYYPLHGVD